MPLQLQSTVKSDSTLEIALVDIERPEPNSAEVVVRVDASPINPSDLGLLFGMADMSKAKVSGTAERPVVQAPIPEGMLRHMAGRVDQPMPVGNEGAGVVIAAGESDQAQALMGKTVAILGGAMYAQYRCLPAKQCLVLPNDATPRDGASCFVNPLTALGMVETMRLEGHSALVHTAAASNLGQMLNKICQQDGVQLVNIVRKAEQESLLRGIGAQFVCNSSSASFMDDLTDALASTSATLAFDATGGGKLAGQILTCMEAATSRNADGYSRYGSTTHKQVYIYGGLDHGPTVFNRSFGMAWGVGGWLLTAFLQRIGPEAAQQLRERVAREVKTTFASHYDRTVSLAEALQLDAISVYGKQATGHKFLIEPNRSA
ncbi:MAG: zinc-binding dehydrogenase [Gammaproteobacteria bacterium]|nr:zinc-binding dehydrogenase [Gammaproteobacteria bacterium]